MAKEFLELYRRDYSTNIIGNVKKYNTFFTSNNSSQNLYKYTVDSGLSDIQNKNIKDKQFLNDIIYYYKDKNNNYIDISVVNFLNNLHESNKFIAISCGANRLYKMSFDVDYIEKYNRFNINRIGYIQSLYPEYNGVRSILLNSEISYDDKYILIMSCIPKKINKGRHLNIEYDNIDCSIYDTHTLERLLYKNIKINKTIIIGGSSYYRGFYTKIDIINNKIYIAFPPDDIYIYDLNTFEKIGQYIKPDDSEKNKISGSLDINRIFNNGYIFIDNEYDKFNFGFVNLNPETDSNRFTMCKLDGNNIVPYKYTQIPLVKISKNAYITIGSFDSELKESTLNISLLKYDNINKSLYFNKIDGYESKTKLKMLYRNMINGDVFYNSRKLRVYIRLNGIESYIVPDPHILNNEENFEIKPDNLNIQSIKINNKFIYLNRGYTIYDTDNLNKNLYAIKQGKEYIIKIHDKMHKLVKSRYTFDEIYELYKQNKVYNGIELDVIPIKPSIDINKSIVSISCEIPFKYRIKLDNSEYSMYSNSFESSTQLDLSKILIGNIESITIEATPIYSLQSSEHSTVKTYNKSDIINYIPSLNIINNDNIKISDNNRIYKNIIPIEFKNNTSKISINHTDMNFNRLAISIDNTVSKFYNVEINYKNAKYIDSCIISDDNFSTPIDIDIKLIKKENIENQVIVGTVDVTMKLYKEGD